MSEGEDSAPRGRGGRGRGRGFRSRGRGGRGRGRGGRGGASESESPEDAKEGGEEKGAGDGPTKKIEATVPVSLQLHRYIGLSAFATCKFFAATHF